MSMIGIGECNYMGTLFAFASEFDGCFDGIGSCWAGELHAIVQASGLNKISSIA